MKSIKNLMLLATLLALPFSFTSCDDILGEWSKPVPNPVTPSDGGEGDTPTPKTAGSISFASETLTRGTLDPIINALTKTGDGAVTYSSSNAAVATVDPNTGEVTPVGTGTTTITATVSDSEGYTYAVKSQSYDLTLQEAGYSYLKWNDGTKQVEQAFVTDNIVEVTNTTNTTWNDASKIYVVKGSVTLSKITISRNSKIILCDGATLTVTGGVDGGDHSDLIIYAQSEGEGMGELSVSTVKGTNIEIHGGKLIVTATGDNGSSAISASHLLSIYGGDITAQGASNASDMGGAGINAPTTITGKAKVTATGGASTSGSNSGGNGIRIFTGMLTISGDAEVIATGGRSVNKGGDGIDSGGSITISDNAHVTATGGESTSSTGGIGIIAVSSITISGDAHVTATGGKGVNGGIGIGVHSNVSAEENAVVTITGGNGTNGNGGYGAGMNNYNFTINGANVTIRGGNAGGTGDHNGGDACYRTSVKYQGGKFGLAGGAGSTSGSNGKAMKLDGVGINLSNNSGADATFQYSTDGSAWTDFTVIAGSSDNSENVQKRYLRTKE